MYAPVSNQKSAVGFEFDSNNVQGTALDLEKLVDYGENPLMTACRNRNLNYLQRSDVFRREVNTLFECKKEKCQFFKKSISLLHLACQNKDLPVVKFLLANRADFMIKTSSGHFPIHLACVMVEDKHWSQKEGDESNWTEQDVDNNRELVECLLPWLGQSGLDINDTYTVSCNHGKCNHGKEVFTLLQLACGSQNEGAVLALLKHGADANCPTNISTAKPIHLLCSMKRVNVRIIEALGRAGADMNARFEGGTTSLHQLCGSKGGNINKQVVTRLIDFGADATAKDAKGWQAIHYAAKARNHELIQVLVEKGGADPGARISSRGGVTPLHLAVDRAYYDRHGKRYWRDKGTKCEETINTLLGYGADPNIRGVVSPCTPGEIAAFSCMVASVVGIPFLVAAIATIDEEMIPYNRTVARSTASCCPGLSGFTPLEMADEELRIRMESRVHTRQPGSDRPGTRGSEMASILTTNSGIGGDKKKQ